MALKALSYTFIGTCIDLIIYGIFALIVAFILIIEVMQFYKGYRMKHTLEVELEVVTVQSSVDLDDISQKPSNTGNSDTTSSPATFLPFLSALNFGIYIFYVLFMVSYIFVVMEYEIDGTCYAMGIPGFLYGLGKICLYLMFLYRLYFVYSDSVFQYNTKLLVIVAFVSVASIFLWAVMNLITKKTVILDVEGHTFCAVHNKNLVVSSLLIYDLFVNIVWCYFFIRPLLWLNKMEQSKEKEIMRSLVVKYVILTVITAATTVLSLLLFMGSQMSLFCAIDAVINSFCVMFFHTTYDKYYSRICCGAHRCGAHIMNKCCPN